MYQSELNIKHTNKCHLYWGIDKNTDQIVSITDVVDRGLNCNCKCPVCGVDYIARLGKVNKHHFGHRSNYECVYANEIAIYMLVRDMLESMRTIVLPAIPVKIGKRIVWAKEEWNASVDAVHYSCAPEQYPPLLVASLDNRPTRIILSFGKYYTEEDMALLESEADEKQWDLLSIEMPQISDGSSATADIIKQQVILWAEGKEWLRNSRAARWRERLEKAAAVPRKIEIPLNSNVFDCPIHQQCYNGTYYARFSDCESCVYNLRINPTNRCLAFSGIRDLRDFKRPLEERMSDIERLRKENDRRIAIAQEDLERRKSLQNFKRLNYHYSQKQKPYPRPVSAQEARTNIDKIRQDRIDVAKRLENPSDELVFDMFRTRWVKCERCLENKTTDEMASYGGKGKANRGLCRKCVLGR